MRDSLSRICTMWWEELALDITGVNAFVTGANRGLGSELVRALLDSGAQRVVACARNPDTLGNTVALDPSRVTPLKLDITKPQEIAAAAAAAPKTTLLVNNAGVLDYAGALATTEGEIERNMTTNFLGTFAMTRAFAPVLEANGGGTVVNVLSFLSFVAAPIFAAYNASKAASWSMAMSLRVYLAPKNIKIVNVFPTSIDTEMLAKITKDKDAPADVARDIVAGIASGQEDIFPMNAKATCAAWRGDQKAVEQAFARLM
jgi:NAD(P)-dependent dehydrogenase (short-subunit alcohol dehydrogenase family)